MTALDAQFTKELHLLVQIAQRDAETRSSALEACTGGYERLPEAVLGLLDWDDNLDIRFAAAAARSGAEQERAYARLATDPATSGHSAIRENPRMVPSHALMQSAAWADARVRADFARYANSGELTESLVRDRSPEVRRSAASNHGLPDSLLRLLCRDSDHSVSTSAEEEQGRRERSIRERADDAHDPYADIARWSLAVHEILRLKVSSEIALRDRVARASVGLDYVGTVRVLRQLWVPPDALRALGTSSRQARAILEVVASHPNTPADVLGQFAMGVWGDEIACLALANPSMDTRLLIEFATSQVPGYRVADPQMIAVWSNRALPESLILALPTTPSARRGLARNFAAPETILSRLVEDEDLTLRREVAANPATPASVLEGLAASSAADVGVAQSLVRNPSLPGRAMDMLLTNWAMRVWVASCDGLSVDVLVRLAADEDPRVRLAIAKNPSTPRATFDALREDPAVREIEEQLDAYRRNGIQRLAQETEAKAPLTAPASREEAAETLLRSLGVHSRARLAEHASPVWTVESEFIKQVLARDSSQRVRDSIAIHGTDSLRRTLLEVGNDDPYSLHDVDMSVAFHTRDRALAADLITREGAWLGLALNPVTPADVLEGIFERTEHFRENLAAHSNASPRLLERLAAAAQSDPKVARSLAENLHTGSDILRGLAGHEEPSVRRAVAAHRATHPTVLANLAADSDFVVRAIVAMNRHTTPETLERMATDSCPTVRQLVASNPRAPRQVWTALAVDADPATRALARRYLTPSAIARMQLAARADIGSELLRLLAADEDAEVRIAVARNASSPASLLGDLVGDTEYRVRLAVAERDDLPLSALALLGNDSVWRVRHAARSTQRRAHRR